jgi:hypothetical protein
MKKYSTRWDESEKEIKRQKNERIEFNKNLRDLVYNYPTKYPEGFITEEQRELLKQFPNINMDKYNDALTGITCMRDNSGDFIIYHCDILTALKCGIEDRDINLSEWD